jgi:hypothetical protein
MEMKHVLDYYVLINKKFMKKIIPILMIILTIFVLVYYNNITSPKQKTLNKNSNINIKDLIEKNTIEKNISNIEEEKINESLKIEDCNKNDNSFEKEYCTGNYYKQQAENKDDLSLCDKIEKEEYKYECRYNIILNQAKIKNDISLCNTIYKKDESKIIHNPPKNEKI